MSLSIMIGKKNTTLPQENAKMSFREFSNFQSEIQWMDENVMFKRWFSYNITVIQMIYEKKS